ncbi:MFS transporter [Rhizobium skierniewicense]|uniref:MFS transporter n=1 Tax=Rhizobium TaxID=379 RepID=UPI0009E2E7EE|nr:MULTISPECIES: MFS transporter [Rhizobium]MBD8687364.1 MFS transporter [Rhizobium sp. CFBP 13644]MBD8691818.1 MFS transporter [Rhizobium sp. CFBP 13717]MCI9866989.1 MFS transporter [Rhizobium skierniewicense]
MLRPALLAMTAIAVVSDTMLLPYYPQLFAARFSISSSFTVGAYLASISLAVMLAFPVWVAIAKRRDTIAVLIWTQLAAAGFSLACYVAADIASFWVSSIVMVCFKASYLLMYPYVIAMQPVEKHATTIGALAVIVHFGGIIGAVSGGHVVGSYGYAIPYVIMGLGDVIQAAICAVLLKTASVARARKSSREDDKGIIAVTPEERKNFASLLAVMFFFYFGFYLSMPFMTVWWQSVARNTSPDITGFVYAIPGIVAVAILAHGFWRAGTAQVWRRNEAGLVLTSAGLAIQAVPDQICIIIGRIIYGIGLYRVTIGLDALFFERAQKAHYASGFSLLNIARNSGVMLAALVSGMLTQRFGEGLSFAVAALVVLATLLLYRATLRAHIGLPSPRPQPA